MTLKPEHAMTEVKPATGRSWEEWFSALDKRGGIAKGRRDIGNFLYT